MTPDTVGQEIAKRTYAALSGAGLQAALYPSRGQLPVLPSLLLYWTGFGVTYGMPEQEWRCTFTGQLLIATYEQGSDTLTNFGVLDGMIAPLADAWSPDTATGKQNFILGGAVDRCAFQPQDGPDGALAQAIVVNGKVFLGGVLTWTADFRRLSGS